MKMKKIERRRESWNNTGAEKEREKNKIGRRKRKERKRGKVKTKESKTQGKSDEINIRKKISLSVICDKETKWREIVSRNKENIFT